MVYIINLLSTNYELSVTPRQPWPWRSSSEINSASAENLASKSVKNRAACSKKQQMSVFIADCKLLFRLFAVNHAKKCQFYPAIFLQISRIEYYPLFAAKGRRLRHFTPLNARKAVRSILGSLNEI